MSKEPEWLTEEAVPLSTRFGWNRVLVWRTTNGDAVQRNAHCLPQECAPGRSHMKGDV